ncbi:hypothetical protein AAG570_000758 [Ranatra chinensis]|uniref:Uncharacterized protein n=1 Tax=Ranatra chinensis TaxID=642074 RepID=A0ABD0YYA8_9HEMI
MLYRPNKEKQGSSHSVPVQLTFVSYEFQRVSSIRKPVEAPRDATPHFSGGEDPDIHIALIVSLTIIGAKKLSSHKLTMDVGRGLAARIEELCDRTNRASVAGVTELACELDLRHILTVMKPLTRREYTARDDGAIEMAEQAVEKEADGEPTHGNQPQGTDGSDSQPESPCSLHNVINR